MRPFIIREEIEHFVAKDGSATRLQHNNRNFRFDFRGQGIKRSQQQPLGTIQHAEIVKRTAAAQAGFGYDHTESGSLEDLDRGLGGIR